MPLSAAPPHSVRVDGTFQQHAVCWNVPSRQQSLLSWLCPRESVNKLVAGPVLARRTHLPLSVFGTPSKAVVDRLAGHDRCLPEGSPEASVQLPLQVAGLDALVPQVKNDLTRQPLGVNARWRGGVSERLDE